MSLGQRKGPLAAAGCILVLVLFLFGGIGCLEEPDLLREGVLVVGLESEPTRLDPRLATDAASSRIGDLIYRRLFRKDVNGRPIEDLVRTWDQPDATTYRFKILEGIRFHDGRVLDARDVKYTFQSILDPALKSPLRGRYDMIESVESPEPLTVVFRLRETFASFLVNLDVGIIPRPDPEQPTEHTAAVPPGCGPFRFHSWKRGSEIRLVSDPGFPGGGALLREVRFKIVPDNTVRILELRKGSIHLVLNEIEPGVLSFLENDPRFSVRKGEGTSYSYLGFNLRDSILKNEKVRKAIAHAIDRKSIVEHLLGGLAVPATGVLSPLNWAYDPEVERYPYDPKKAGKLLDEAGYPDPDGKGPGKRFSLSYKTSQNELRRRIGEAIQSQLSEVGIGVDIRSYEWGTFYSDIQKGNFQTFTLTWVGITDPDIFYYLFDSRSIPPNGANRGYYLNPEVDGLIQQGRRTIDPESRKKTYGKIQKKLAQDLPYVSLWYAVNVAVMDQRVRGFVLFPDGNFSSLKDVWIELDPGRSPVRHNERDGETGEGPPA
jgi:peptide/nickel transport system substrate-binding protein